MNGYEKAEIRAKMIASGIDPDAGPSPRERLVFKYGMPILAFIFYGALGYAFWVSFTA